MKNYLSSAAKFLTSALLVVFGSALASDHTDAPATINDPVADLLDLYAFVEPFCQASGGVGCEADPDELILALTLNPEATSDSQFSEDVVYHFYIENDAGISSQIDCSFDDGQVSCSGLDGLSVQARPGEVATSGDIRLFAGLRDDPFFADTDALFEFASFGVLALEPPGTDTLAGSNVLAIVLGVKTSAFPPGAAPDHNLLKIWAASERTGGGGLNGAFTGSWYNPAQNGQGWVIEMLEGASGEMSLLSFFYGYDNNGEQLWLITGASAVDGNQATAEVYRTSATGFGGAFDPDSFALGDVVGSVVFDFENCDSGTVTFTSADPDTLADFTNPITRITNIASLDCALLTAGQVDRLGRPLVSFTIPDEKKNSYNTASDPASWAALFQDDIEAGLVTLDGADFVLGNGFSEPETLAPIFADDRLQVDIKKGQTVGYFTIEASALVPQDWNDMGGRALWFDIVDETLSMLVSGWDPVIGDFVDENDLDFLDDFPFLAPPH